MQIYIVAQTINMIVLSSNRLLSAHASMFMLNPCLFALSYSRWQQVTNKATAFPDVFAQ